MTNQKERVLEITENGRGEENLTIHLSSEDITVRHIEVPWGHDLTKLLGIATSEIRVMTYSDQTRLRRAFEINSYLTENPGHLTIATRRPGAYGRFEDYLLVVPSDAPRIY